MATSSARKVTSKDYYLLKAVMTRHLKKMLSWPDAKAWFKYIDLEHVLQTIMASEHAYIVDDAFLVVYDIVTPWYSKQPALLEEVIILRLVPGGNFANVPLFLEQRAQEAGVRMVCAGTALARTDAALASLYAKAGYTTETHVVVKELHGQPIQGQ